MKSLLAETKVAFLFLAVFTVLVGLSFIERDSDKVVIRELKDVEADSKRVPASFEPEDDPIFNFGDKPKISTNIEFGRTGTFETHFFCNSSLNGKKHVKNVKNRLVLLSFKVCKDLKKIESVSLTNSSNGFKAQIFNAEDGFYKTDYIQLNAGTNLIKLDIVLKDGQKNSDSLEIVTGS